MSLASCLREALAGGGVGGERQVGSLGGTAVGDGFNKKTLMSYGTKETAAWRSKR